MIIQRPLTSLAVFYSIACILSMLGSLEIPPRYIEYISKPLLMPILAVILYKNAGGYRNMTLIKLIFGALFFAFLGDVFLMFPHINPNYFLAGLGAFLVAHIAYIFAFLQTPQSKSTAIFKKLTPFALLLFAFSGCLLYSLSDTLGDLFFPVIVYTIVINLMVLAAASRYNLVNNKSFWWLFLGATLFLISDTLIAVNKFLMPLPMPAFWIMPTYCAGQFAIVWGVIYQVSKERIMTE